jgi:hypothetical protein
MRNRSRSPGRTRRALRTAAGRVIWNFLLTVVLIPSPHKTGLPKRASQRKTSFATGSGNTQPTGGHHFPGHPAGRSPVVRTRSVRLPPRRSRVVRRRSWGTQGRFPAPRNATITGDTTVCRDIPTGFLTAGGGVPAHRVSQWTYRDLVDTLRLEATASERNAADAGGGARGAYPQRPRRKTTVPTWEGSTSGGRGTLPRGTCPRRSSKGGGQRNLHLSALSPHKSGVSPDFVGIRS